MILCVRMSLENRGLSLNSTDFRKLLPKYLLGELSSEEIAEIDEKYLFDDSFADALEDVRRDLLDSLAAGELGASEHKRVEQALAKIPHHDGAVRIARALQARQEKSRPAGPQVRKPYGIWAAAALVLCVAILAIFVRRQGSVGSPPGPQASGAMPSPSTVPPTQQDGGQDQLVFVVLLSPDVSRGADAPLSFMIPGAARYVEFQIVLPASGKKARYEVSVFSNAKKEPLTVSGLELKTLGGQQYLEFRTLAGSLPPGKYSIRVSAETTVRPLLVSYEISLTHSPLH
jgi:hypothetical protein